MKYYKRIVVAIVGIFFIAVGVAFNAGTMLGNDPIALMYDGVREFLGLSVNQLGLVSNGVNLLMLGVLFLIGRRYINLGTVIYIVPFGTFVTIGSLIYQSVFSQFTLLYRILGAFAGCTMVYVGVAIFIVMELGLDPATGIVMALSDKLKWSFRKTKICFDLTFTVVGVVLGGTIGVLTVVTIITAGPCIQFISEQLKKRLH